jgi:transcriptional regulator with XRE-family HTH domain
MADRGHHDESSFHVKRDADGLTLGQRLRKARLQASGRTHPPRPIGQQEVADLFGASQDAVSRWEKDQREPGLEVLQRLADFYGVDRDWLTYGSRESDVGAKINAMSDPNAGGDDDADATIAKLKARQAKTPKTKGSGGKSA